MGGVFPLVTGAMFKHLTFQGASSLLGGIVRIIPYTRWHAIGIKNKLTDINVFLGCSSYCCTVGTRHIRTANPCAIKVR